MVKLEGSYQGSETKCGGKTDKMKVKVSKLQTSFLLVHGMSCIGSPEYPFKHLQSLKI